MKALLPLLLAFLLVGEEPPSPEDRVASMRRNRAGQRVKLADRARNRKLGTDARAHYLAALHLDPGHRTARSRLGHRKVKDGTWSRDREKEFKDGKGAREKNREAQLADEIALAKEEAAAFAKLGNELKAEGHEELARPLLVRAALLDPTNAAAAAGLGLVPIQSGFGTQEVADFVRRVPPTKKSSHRGILSQYVGARTSFVTCGAVSAESPTGGAALEELARGGEQVHTLVSRRFGFPLRGHHWMDLVVAKGQPQFNMFVDRTGVKEPRLGVSKKLGFLRMWQPVRFISTWVGPMADVRNARLRLYHALAENVLFASGGANVPAWLHEAVGLDANLTLFGRPGPLCVVYETSTGLRDVEHLDDPAGWPALLLRRAATGRIARLEHLVPARLTGLRREDVVTGHAYYRLLLLTRRKGLGSYVAAHVVSKDSVASFKASFGVTPERLTEELRTALLGGPPLFPLERPAGK